MANKQNKDPSNIIGYGVGFFMLLIVVLSRGSITVFISVPSFLIVFIGTMASTLNSHSAKNILRTFSILFQLITRGSQFQYSLILDQLVKSAEIIRKKGPLALEKQKLSSPFLKKGIYRIIDGTKTESLVDIFEIENYSLMERHKEGQQILETMGSFAPAWGLIGTIIGLIFMLLTLDNPSNIGPAMATALLTTLYGAILANLVFIPASTKLESFSEKEMKFRRFIIEGVISVANSENPRVLREKLLAFLSPREKNKKILEIKENS